MATTVIVVETDWSVSISQSRARIFILAIVSTKPSSHTDFENIDSTTRQHYFCCCVYRHGYHLSILSIIHFPFSSKIDWIGTQEKSKYSHLIDSSVFLSEDKGQLPSSLNKMNKRRPFLSSLFRGEHLSWTYGCNAESTSCTVRE